MRAKPTETSDGIGSPGGSGSSVACDNALDTVDGQWFAFIGDTSGKIVAHSDPSMIGQNTQSLRSGAEDFEVREGVA